LLKVHEPDIFPVYRSVGHSAEFTIGTVGVTLLDLVPAQYHQPDLFADAETDDVVSPVIDKINRRFGRNTIGFGRLTEDIRKFSGHGAFQRVPESWEF